ncbi:hypothetical protein AN958_11502 [Leucoagaricus sp. SymC.cos]|nr:hypothetical protein AN958_11502 [Leucoagaricus sp. SymC.cos]
MSANSPEAFMEEFSKRTICGAAVDSSARDPPSRCHPGTRLTTAEETRELSETSPNLGAALIFSVNGRNDSTKVIATLAYQLATKFTQYFHYARVLVTKDPTIFDKTMAVQFHELVTEPFANRRIYRGTQSLIIFLDGVDECNSVSAQCELLQLISNFIVRYPSCPLLWIAASRPEPHLTGFFGLLDPNLYKRTELSINSDKSYADVEKYLRDSFAQIRSKYPLLQLRSQWPTEHQLIKVITAAHGLFAYGNATVRFIDDSESGNPQSQLELLLEVIDNLPSKGNNDEQDADPMARLDALYDCILSRIPKRTFRDTLCLLYFTGILRGHHSGGYELAWATEWLRMSPDATYGSLHHLHSVLLIPSIENACNFKVEAHHKSFRDYLEKRFPVAEEDSEEIFLNSAIAILNEIPQEAGSLGNWHPSHCLTLYWHPPDRREDLYIDASWTVQSSKLTCRRIIAHDLDTLHALRVMTNHVYGVIDRVLPIEPARNNWLMALDSTKQDEMALRVLKEFEVFRGARVGSLDLDRIWSSMHDFYILYQSRYPAQVFPRTEAEVPYTLASLYLSSPSYLRVVYVIIYLR